MPIAKDLFDKFPVFETERLILRDVEEKDCDSLIEMRSDRETMQYFGGKLLTEPEKMVEAVKRIKNKALKERPSINWILAKKNTDEAVGVFNYIFWHRQYFISRISYILHKKHWGKGYMSEALPHLLKFGFQKMALHRIEAVINPLNTASFNLVEKMGFQKEAVMIEQSYNFIEDKFDDMYLYALLESKLLMIKNK